MREQPQPAARVTWRALERRGLVVPVGGTPDEPDEYRLTEAGRRILPKVRESFETPWQQAQRRQGRR